MVKKNKSPKVTEEKNRKSKSKEGKSKMKIRESAFEQRNSRSNSKDSKDGKKRTTSGVHVELGPHHRPSYPTEEDLKRFGPLSLEAKQAHTAIVLLESEEIHILIESLMSLEKFCNKRLENRELFVVLGGVDMIWKFFHHPHLVIQRLSLKILGALSSLHQVKLLCRDYMVAEELSTLLKSEDPKVLEYATVVCKNLSTLFAGRIQIIRHDGIGLLLVLAQHDDPDVAKNGVESIFNILEETLHNDLILEPENIEMFLKLTDSKYQSIQLAALSVIEKLTRSPAGVRLLQDTRILDNLAQKLGDNSLQDLHRVALQILLNLTYDVTNCQKMSFFLIKLTTLLDESKDLQVLIRTTKLFGKMARIPAITHLLVNNYDFVAKLILIMSKYADPEIRTSATYTAAQIGATDFNAKRLLAKIFKPLKAFFFDPRANLESFENILLTSSVILEGGYEPGKQFVKDGGIQVLRHVCAADVTSGKFTNPTTISALACINSLGHFPRFREVMIREGLLPVILNQMTSSSSHIVTLATNALCSLLCLIEGRRQFSEKEGYKYIAIAATSPELNVAVALSPLINVIGSYPDMALELVNKGLLTTLWERQDLISTNGPLRTALDRLISNHLPAKYAYTGHIGPYEKLPLGFYDVGNIKSSQVFVPLEDIKFGERDGHQKIIYVNFDRTPQPNLYQHNPIMRILEDEETPSLLSYAAQVRNLIPSNVRSEKDLVGLIACCVCAKMGGPLDKWRVSVEAEEAELADFQSKQQSVGIPLTLITNGAHRPRALMFKALADIFGIPSSLDRGGFKKCWNVVLIRAKDAHNSCPCPETPEDEQNIFFTEKLSRFVVDLVYTPGSLFPLYSYEADTYCFC